MKKLLALVLIFGISSMPISNADSVKGSQGQVLSVSKTTVKSGSVVTVKGNYFDETVGIYLAFCVIPAKGQAPTPCGGGINKAGLSEASFWISSNPPPYAVGLTEEFLPGGRFMQKVKISKKIAMIAVQIYSSPSPLNKEKNEEARSCCINSLAIITSSGTSC
jgi:hypothetical protein